jgi:DNA-binding transcriptional LysR family regulator
MINRDRKSDLSKRVSVFRGVDLNLFLVLSAVYELNSVTGAAKALGLTQPAVSHALGRLREALNDELFIRSGNNVVPTPFTSNIIDDVHSALHLLQSGPLGGENFEAKHASIEFRVAMPGGMEIFLLPKLIAHVNEYAPNIRISATRVPRQNIETELARAGVHLVIDTDVPGNLSFHRQPLASDTLIVAARKNNPYIKGALSQESYLGGSHILVSSKVDGGGVEDYELARQDLKRNIAVRCAVLTAALRTAAISDHMVTLGKQQLEVLEPFHDLATYAFPFTQPRMEAMMMWHDLTDNDPANIWLRATIKTFFDSLPQ